MIKKFALAALIAIFGGFVMADDPNLPKQPNSSYSPTPVICIYPKAPEFIPTEPAICALLRSLGLPSFQCDPIYNPQPPGSDG